MVPFSLDLSSEGGKFVRNIKFAIVFITLITLTAFITFSPRQYSDKSATISRSHNKLPILAEDTGTEKHLTEIGIFS